MASQIGWIDFSPRHRDRVKRFMDLMGMGGVVDELGVGIIRDAMSNKVFPGFSTLYTRAKYFFITPYILEDYETASNKSNSGKAYFKKAEEETNKIIINFYDKHSERSEESYFGKVNRSGILKRQPSEIYWNGMTRLHLIKTDSTLDQLLLNKHSTMEELLSNNRGDDTTKEQGEYKGYGSVGVSYTPDWRQYIRDHGLTLSRNEAELLRDRLIKYTPDSLPAALVSSKSLWDKYSSKYDSEDPLCNPMLHFIRTSLNEIENNTLRKNLIMSHDLSLFLYGIHVAYNLLLRIKTDASVTRISGLRKQGQMWYSELDKRMLDSKNFDICNCMAGTNVKPPTEKFLKDVQNLVRNPRSWDEIEDKLCRLVETQEQWNKKTKSRFLKIEKGQVLDKNITNDEQWVGLGLINYRYASALSIVKDLYEGLDDID